MRIVNRIDGFPSAGTLTALNERTTLSVAVSLHTHRVIHDMKQLTVTNRLFDDLEIILKPLRVVGKFMGGTYGELGRHIDIVADVEFDTWTKRFLIDVKSRGEPFHVTGAASQVVSAAAEVEGAYGCIAAPFLSNWTREMLDGKGTGALDLAGNLLIHVDGIYIERSGRKAVPEGDIKISLFSPKATQVYEQLIEQRDHIWSPGELAEAAGVSRALVHKLLGELTRRGFVESETAGRRRRLRLSDGDGLAAAWREAVAHGRAADRIRIEDELGYVREEEVMDD